MVAGQTTRYQKEIRVAFAGKVNVCASELSVEAVVAPTIADCAPECTVVLTEVRPLEVQPVSPDSNPPLVTPDPPDPAMVQETLTLCVNEPLVPVTVIG